MLRRAPLQLGCRLSSRFLTNHWQFVSSTYKLSPESCLSLFSFSWTRNGTHFDVDDDPNVTMRPHSGTLVVDISRVKAEQYECVYQCTARNKHGTAVSNNIAVRQSSESLYLLFSLQHMCSSHLFHIFSPFFRKQKLNFFPPQTGCRVVDEQHAFVQGCMVAAEIGPLHSPLVFILFTIAPPSPSVSSPLSPC